MRGAEYILMYSFGVCRRDGEHALFEEGSKKYSSVAPRTLLIFNGYGYSIYSRTKSSFIISSGQNFSLIFSSPG